MITTTEIKELAKELGADLCGIALFSPSMEV
jgi:hypothetical protein